MAVETELVEFGDGEGIRRAARLVAGWRRRLRPWRPDAYRGPL